MAGTISRRNILTGTVPEHDVPLHITGLVVHARRDRLSEILDALRQRPGVEIHGQSPAGKIVITLEAHSDDKIVEALGAIGEIPGVLSTALVYQHFEGA